MEKSGVVTVTTDYSRKLYWEEEILPRSAVEDCMKVINIYPEVTGQTIKGFGGAFTEASATNYARLEEDSKKSVIEGYYGEKGLRYNLGRLTMNSCDFAKGNYCYIKEGDEELTTFDISHDLEEIIPMIRDALGESGNEIGFLVSPWSPPAFMKTNGEMNNGGQLKEEYYRVWARYFAKFIKAYEREGIRIGSLTVQNEPAATQTWDSCIYSGKEEGIFVRDYLASVLREEGLAHVAVYVWDHNKEEAYDRAKESISVAGKDITGIALHWYTGDHFDSISIIRSMFPGKEVIFTEGCVEYSRFADSGELQKAEMYAHDMLGNLKAGISAFFDWNLLLDFAGGPNHVGNFCAAPMMCSEDGKLARKRLTYYYIGHFSRYIKTGAVQIGTTRYTDQLETVGFLNPDGERVLILLNKSDVPLKAALRENGKGFTEFVINTHTIKTICC